MRKNNKKSYEDQRPLTKSEREAIISGYDNSKKYVGSKAIVIFAVFFIQGLLNGLLGSSFKEIAFICISEIGVLSIYLVIYIMRFRNIVNKVKTGQMYCIEAEYIMTSGKYGRTYLRGYKTPSIEGYDLAKREKFEKGDRVIVLVMRYHAWVYKARE